MRTSSIIATILCAPCMCLYYSVAACFCPSRLHRRRHEPEEKSRFERRQFNAPIPLTKRHDDSNITLPLAPLPQSSCDLTLQLEEKLFRSRKHDTMDQSQSRLMRLPLELRESIYRYALGDNIFHIVLKNTRRLGHLRCGNPHCAPDFPHLSNSCWSVLDRDNVWAPTPGSHSSTTDGGIIPLLRTCRQVYSESIPILYSHNTFSINDLDCLRHLKSTILPARFSTIRHLQIVCTLHWPRWDALPQQLIGNPLFPPHDEASWDEAWKIIGSLEKLKSLVVSLTYFDTVSEEKVEEMILAPLMRIEGVKRYDVYLSWTPRERGDRPFRVMRLASREVL
ncbi:hypothetical protein K432DRAFT_385189 [Lepidopterella palustris CBS 459.81]|uniref:DUF7730 domain-containing protein n=1 Tax=Lepidopterella palustris CBS 459.81 TaxID=1314670 RepID=A0A8E2E3J6_9PEZI|nr:hypothetical protein K432DRAFT_385189 [Lepidopterella palustris CBS 459.81]